MKREVVFKVGKLNVILDRLFLVLLIIMLVSGHLWEFLITLTSIFLHESGHMVLAIHYKCKIEVLRILPIGLNAVINAEACSPKERLAIYISGPIINVFLAFISYMVSPNYVQHPNNMQILFFVNIYLFVFNLLPVIPLDGGMILKDILEEKFGIFLVSRLIKRFSILLSVAVIVAGIVQVLEDMHNFSLAAIGFYILSSSFKEMEAAIMNIKNIIYRRSRLLKKGIYPARDLVVVRHMHLSDIIKNLDFDRFHIIHVLDDELKLLKVFTEQEIIEAMLKHGMSMTFEEFIKQGP